MYRKEMISAIISHKDNLREDELKHHGILGQKWGVRRYQNADGSYTAEGRERYGIGDSKKSSESKEGGIFNRIKEKNRIKKELEIERNKRDHDYEEMQKIIKTSTNDFFNSQSSKTPEEMLSEIGVSGYQEKINEYRKNKDKVFDECSEIMSDFNKDNEFKYAAIASIVNNFHQNSTVGGLANGIWFDTCEDGDMGGINSASVYAKDKGIERQISNNISKIEEYDNELKTNIKTDVKSTLANKGNFISDDNDPSSELNRFSKKFADAVTNKIDRQNGKPAYMFYMAISAMDNNVPKKLMDESKSIVESIMKGGKYKVSNEKIRREYRSVSGKQYRFWDKIYDAIEDLGYTKMKVVDLSSSDWEKIGEKMAELQK